MTLKEKAIKYAERLPRLFKALEAWREVQSRRPAFGRTVAQIEAELLDAYEAFDLED